MRKAMRREGASETVTMTFRCVTVTVAREDGLACGDAWHQDPGISL